MTNPSRGRHAGEQQSLFPEPARPAPARPAPASKAPPTYWARVGPRQWVPVTVTTRYAVTQPPVPTPFPLVCTGTRAAPRNVLIQRPDGSADVVPVSVLRRRKPWSAR